MRQRKHPGFGGPTRRPTRAEPLERRTLLSAITFDDPVSFNTGNTPTGVAVADLGNGNPDVAVTNAGDDTLGILIGNGDATFRAQKTYAVGHRPVAVALADLGNGKVDAVVANGGDGTVSVQLGNGDGTLQTQQTFAVGGAPTDVAVADLGNGHPDIIVANGGDDTVDVLLGNGDGTFASSRSYAVGSNPASLAIADLGNGHPDVVVANAGDGTVGVLIGNGTGTLAAQRTYAVGNDPTGVAVADLGNGHPDVVVANEADNTVGVLLGTGAGTLGSQQTFNAPGGPTRVAIADMGNGHPDVVTALSSTSVDTNVSLSGVSVLIGKVGILQGNGDGTLGGQSTYAMPGVPTGLVVANVDNYHLPDVIVSNSFDVSGTSNKTTFSVLRNTTSAGATTTTHLTFAGPPADAISSASLAPITVNVAAAGGNKVLPTDGSDVTLSIATGPAGATLSGPTTVQASGGVATFTGLTLSAPGSYTLVATGNGIAPVTSNAFTVLAGPPTGPATPVGTLDQTFGTKGIASHNVGFTATAGVAADGTQSVLVGPIGTAPNETFGVTRYNADGSLDTSFGTHGVTATAFAGTDAVPAAVAVLADGSILVAGTATTAGSGSEFAVAKYTAAGALDPSFGTNGTVVFAFPASGAITDDVLRALVPGPNGRIYLGGKSDAAGKGNSDFAVAALTSAGAFDAGFGTDGRTLLDVAGGDDALAAMAVQSNGGLIVAGSGTVGGVTEVAMARLFPVGVQDLHFGTKGFADASVGGIYDAATSIAIAANGAIVLGGVTATGSAAAPGSDFLVQRYTANGKPDRSFGKAGTVTTTFGQPSAVTQVIALADGSIIASGRTGGSLSGTLDVAVARYTVKGILNTGFNGTGKIEISLTSGIVASAAAALGAAFDAFAASQQGVVAVTPGGEIVVAGNSGANTVEAELIATGVDLVAAVLASSVPAAGVGGLKGSATLTITDAGTEKASGSMTVVVGFSSTAAGAGSITVKSVTQKTALAPGKARTLRVSFTYPTGLAGGGYYLVTTVTGGTATAIETNGANNTAIDPSAVTIAPPVIKLTGSALAAVPPPFAVGGKGKVSIALANGGNVTAKGQVVVGLYLSTDDQPADGTALGTAPLAIAVPTGRSHAYRLAVTLPASITAGTYNLLAVVDPTLTLGTADQTDVSAIVVGAVPVVVS
jgi:uncharacterized delta-60 repeat protein